MAKNSPFWLDGRATIVVLPSGDEGMALFALAENWSEVGLLGPALWVEPKRVSTREGEPVLVNAVVMGNDRSGNHVQIVVDLFEQLAKENLSTIRLIQVRSVTPTAEFDQIQDDVARQVADAVYTVIPSGDTRNNRKAYLGFHVVNLIAAPSAHTVEQRLQDVLSHGGGTTIVASPEDRSSPWSTDAFVRNGRKFVGFVLMHLSTVGGLWKGLPVGTLELFEREGSAGESVYLSRVFVSSVLTDGLARRVAAQVLQDTIDPEVIQTTAPSGSAYIEDGSKDEYIDSMVKYLMALDDAVLDYRRPAELEDPEKTNVGIWAALGSFSRFAWEKSLRIPYWAYRFARNKFAMGVQKRLQGTDGYADVERELREEPLDMRDRTILTRQGMLAERERAARTANAAPVRLSEIRSTPYLWSSIREMVFGSLDGGADLSEKGFPRVDTTIRPIFRSPEDLFPSPEAVFELRQSPSFPQGIPSSIDWENYGDAFEIGQRLEKWAKESDNAVSTINFELGDFAIELSEIDTRLADIEIVLREHDLLEDLEGGGVKLVSIADAKLLDKERLASQQQSPSEVPATEPEREESAEALPAEDLPVQIDQQADATLSLEALVREHKSLSARKTAVVKAVPEAEQKSLDAQDEGVLRQEVLGDYRKWQEKTDRSLLWKLRSRMEKAVALGQADLKSFQNALESLEPHQIGTLAELRKKFHKSVLVTHSIVMLVAGIVAATGWLFLSSGTSEVQALTPVAFEQQAALQEDLGEPIPATRANLPTLLSSAEELRTDITTQISDASNAVTLDPTDAAAVSQLEALEVKQESVQLYQETLRTLVAAYELIDLGRAILFWTAIITPAVLLVSLLLLFIPYHRKWAAFERSVEIQLTNLERIEKGSTVCRSEIQRISALHSQAIRWLKILATVTHTPWQVRPSWLESGLKTLDLDSLPFAMRIAQAHEGDRASFTTLLDSAQTKLEQPGWRKQAFDRLIAGIQDATGRSGKAFSLEALDQDLPHASNNSRTHLEKYMTDGDILQKVAVQYLKPLIEDLQGKAMANARPEVVQAEDDPLLEFRGDIEGVDEYSNRQKWDDFLSHTLTLNNGESDPVTALSVLSIAPEQIMQGEHENVSSYALIPEHVASKLDPALSEGLIKQTYDAKVARPLDSVIRVDIVGPVNLRALRVVSGKRSKSQTIDLAESDQTTLTKGAFAKKATPAS
jgi:hypothetical protein